MIYSLYTYNCYVVSPLHLHCYVTVVNPLLRSNKPLLAQLKFYVHVYPPPPPCREEGEDPGIVVGQSQDAEKQQLLAELEEKKRRILRDVEVRDTCSC